MQNRARLAAAYGEEDLSASLEELEEFARDLEPTMRESGNKLKARETDVKVVFFTIPRSPCCAARALKFIYSACLECNGSR